MQNNTQFSSPTDPPEFPNKQANVNIGEGSTPLSIESQNELFLGRCAEILQHVGDDRKTWHEIGKPESEQKIFADSVTTGIGSNGNYTVLSIDKARHGKAKDLDGKEYQTRVHNIRRSPAGEPMFCSELMPLWRFCEVYEPDRSWCLPGEWKAMLATCKEALAADKANDLADEKNRQANEEKLRQAAEARLNPHAALASGLAEGIAAALVKLGLAPKADPAK